MLPLTQPSTEQIISAFYFFLLPETLIPVGDPAAEWEELIQFLISSSLSPFVLSDILRSHFFFTSSC